MAAKIQNQGIIISHYYILVEWLVGWVVSVHSHFFEKSDFFIFFTVLFKKLIIKIWKWRFNTKKLDYVLVSLVKKFSSNLIGIPVLQPCEHNRFCRFSYFLCVGLCTAGAPRRVFYRFGVFFHCIFKHTSDINMRITFISQNSSFIVDYDRKKKYWNS